MLAVTLVRAAGGVAHDMRADGLAVDTKGHPSEVVTAADRAAENLVARVLREERPHDGLLAEEGAGVASSSGRTWVVDPVDGTWNYVHGLPTWCAAVAVRDDSTGLALASAVYQPVGDTLWVTGDDWPTTVSVRSATTTLKRPADAPLATVSLGTYLHATTSGDLLQTWFRLCQGAATVRILGSGSVDLSFVAEGRLGAFAQPDVSDWDWLPGATLVRGAGGVAEVVEHGGHRWHFAGSARAVADLTALLSQPSP